MISTNYIALAVGESDFTDTPGFAVARVMPRGEPPQLIGALSGPVRFKTMEGAKQCAELMRLAAAEGASNALEKVRGVLGVRP